MLSLDLLGLLGLSSVFFMFDWKSHEEWASKKYAETGGIPLSKLEFLETKLKRELRVIENKYKDKDDPVSKEKEIDELIRFIDKLKNHFKNRRVFPRDPEKQTELEKLIINAPAPTTRVNINDPKDFARRFFKDPETGMYYDIRSGTPDLPPEMYPEYIKWKVDDAVGYEWDNNRGWFYNTIMMVLTGHG
jgi:hypothetical protein